MSDFNSYKQIFKSTGIIGISQILNILISILRTKFLAVLLGPEGIGIQGMFQASIDMVRSATSFGINFSGVKDIAEANESNDNERIFKIVAVLRRLALMTGGLGTVIMLLFCIPLSNYTFGNRSYSLDFVILSVVILFSSISAAQLTLLQGLRKIPQMALATLFGSLVGTCFTLPLYWLFGRSGIVPGFVLMALCSLVISWFYVRNMQIPKQNISLKITLNTGYGMIKTGFFIVISGFGTVLTMYAIRSLIMDRIGISGSEGLGLAAVGMFQAVWTITRIYMGLLTNAMLADYLPRLSAINTDIKASNQLINEQLEMALLIGVPLIIGMMIFAPLVITTLYSESFAQAVPLLQWQMAATLFSIIVWPLGVLFLSKGRGEYCIMNDLSWCLLFYMLVYCGWGYWGFGTLGIVYPIAGIINCVMVIVGVRHLGRFVFTKYNVRLIAYSLCLILIVLSIVLFFSGVWSSIVTLLCLLVSLVVSYRRLNVLLDLNRFFKNKFK